MKGSKSSADVLQTPYQLAMAFNATSLDWQSLDKLTLSLAQLLSLLAPVSFPWVLVELIAEQLGWDEAQVDISRLNLLDLDFLELTDNGSYQIQPSALELTVPGLTNSAEVDSLRQATAVGLAIAAEQIVRGSPAWHPEDIAAVMSHLASVIPTLAERLTSDQISWCFIALGQFCSDHHANAEAESWYQQGRSLIQARSGSNQTALVICENNLARLYERQKRFDEAERLYQHALDLGHRYLGSAHLIVATSLNNLAGLYKAQERYEKAESLYQQALEIRRQQLGDRHPSVAVSLNNLAGLYYAQGQYDQAKRLYLKALRLRQQSGDAESIATSLNNLACVLYKLGRHNEAAKAATDGVLLGEQVLGSYHPQTIAARTTLDVIESRT